MKTEKEIRDRIKLLREIPDHGLLSMVDDYALYKRIKELEWVLEDER